MKSLFSSSLLLLLIVYFLTVSLTSGSYLLSATAESREAHVALSMIESGEYVLPNRNGAVPSKPPFFHWMVVAFQFVISGQINEFTARLPSVFFATLILLAVAIFVIKICYVSSNYKPEEAATLAFIAVAVLSLTYGFTAMAKRAMVDMTFAFFVITTITFFLYRLINFATLKQADLDRLLTGKDWALFYFVMSLAVLSKGPLGAILPLLVCGCCVWHVLGFRMAARIFSKPRIGWLLFLIIVGTWYLKAFSIGSDAFITRHIFFENLERFGGFNGTEREPLWFYLPSVLRTAAPWSFIFFIVIAYSFWSARTKKTSAISQLAEDCVNCTKNLFSLHERVCLIWFFVGFIFFSLAADKRHSYLLPLYPAIIIFLTFRLNSILRENGPLVGRIQSLLNNISRGAIVLSFIVVSFLLVLFCWGTHFAVMEPIEYIYSWIRESSLLIFSAYAIVFLAIYISFLKKLRLFQYWSCIFGFFLLVISVGNGVKNVYHDYRSIAEEIQLLVPSDMPITSSRPPHEGSLDSIHFYLRRKILVYELMGEAVVCPGYLLVQQQWLDTFEDISRFQEEISFNPEFVANTEKGRIVLLRCT